MDPVLRQRLQSQKQLPFKARAAGVVAMLIIRTMGLTMRLKINDPHSVISRDPTKAIIWALWHNRIFALPLIYKCLMPKIRGVVLTSPSKDGNYLAGLARALSVCSVRGSSSKKGGRALTELKRWMDDGFTLGITPDGPRGPRYQVAPGLIKLSQISATPICTMHIEYSRYWSVHKSWDRFRVPRPFSTIQLNFTLNDPVDPKLDDDAFETVRAEIQRQLNPNHETD